MLVFSCRNIRIFSLGIILSCICFSQNAQFDKLYTNELRAKYYIAEIEQALAGGQIITKSVSTIDSVAFVVPAAGSSKKLVVKELSGFTGQVFANGDIVGTKTYTRIRGDSVAFGYVWGMVTYLYRNATKLTQAYTFTRSTGADSGSVSAGTSIPIGTIVLDFGQVSGGYTEQNAMSGIYSPYIQTSTWSTHPARPHTIQTRIGNLSGVFDTDLGGYLSGVGTYINGNAFIKGNMLVKSNIQHQLKANSIQIGNIINTAQNAIKLTNTDTASTSGLFGYDDYGNTVFQLALDGQAKISGFNFNGDSVYATGYALKGGAYPFMRLGADGYNNGNGLWTGYNDGFYKFFIGSSSGNKLTWDGEHLNIVGTATIDTGDIGGFVIGNNNISATNLSLTSGNANVANITVGSGANAGGLNSANASNDIIFWGGSTYANRATAPFRILADGSAYVSYLEVDSGDIAGTNFDNLVSGSGTNTYLTVWNGSRSITNAPITINEVATKANVHDSITNYNTALDTSTIARTNRANSFSLKQTVDSIKVNNLSSGYLPYQDNFKLVNSPIYTANNNVGIGTTNPNCKLQVEGEVGSIGLSKGFRVSSANGDNINDAPWYGLGLSNITLNSQPSTAVQLAGYFGLNFQTASGQVVILNNGNIGIGTTSPSDKLHVTGGGLRVDADNGAIILNSSGATTNTHITFQSAGSTTWELGKRDVTNSLYMWNGVSDVFTLTTNGNIGIGTTDPQDYKLYNNGTLYNNGNATIAGSSLLTSSAYASGYFGSGWRLDGSTNTMELDNLVVRNSLRTHIFQKDVVKVVQGMLAITANASEIRQESASASGYIYTKENIGTGAYCWYKEVEDNGTVVGIKFHTTSEGTTDAGWLGYRHSITVDDGSGTFRVGGTIVRIDGGGIIADASSNYSPFIDIYDGVTNWTDFQTMAKLKTRIGNLSGLTDTDFGTINGYGIYTQNGYFKGNIIVKSDSALALSDATIKIGNITGTANSAIKLTNTGTAGTSGLFGYTSNGAESFALKLDGGAKIGGFYFDNNAIQSANCGITYASPLVIRSGSTPYIQVGRTNACAYDGPSSYMYYTDANNYGLKVADGSKIYFHAGSYNKLGGTYFNDTTLYVGAGTYNNSNTAYFLSSSGRMSLKDKFVWDGDNLSLNGTINATSGEIGGFSIGEYDLYAGAGATRIQIASDSGFWCGATNRLSAPFSVTPSGDLTAKSGKIGNTTIVGDSLIGGIIKTSGSGNKQIIIDGVNNEIKFSINNNDVMRIGTGYVMDAGATLYYGSSGQRSTLFANNSRYDDSNKVASINIWENAVYKDSNYVANGFDVMMYSNVTGSGHDIECNGINISMQDNDNTFSKLVGTSIGVSSISSVAQDLIGIDSRVSGMNNNANLKGGRFSISATSGIAGADVRGVDVYVKPGASISTSSPLYGVYAEVIGRSGTDNVYGIYASASGGTNNWAGYFNGAVYISSSLKIGDIDLIDDSGYLTSLGGFKAWDYNNILDNDGLTISSGGINSSPTYSTAVGGTNRDLYIDDSGVIGYLSSSKKYKSNITDLQVNTNNLYKLRPVSYLRSGVKEFGLIAEEVNDVMPELVSYDKNGEPETVQYSSLPVLLLKELQKHEKEIEELKAITQQQAKQIESITQQLQKLLKQQTK